MDLDKYNKQTLVDYLLGNLPEAETDRFDELSISDDDFANSLKSVEDDLIDSYLHKELPENVERRFEAIYFASPLRRERVEFARALKTFAASSELPKIQVADSKESEGIFAFLGNWGAVFKLGFAALLLLFAGTIAWIFLNDREVPLDEVKVIPTPSPARSIDEKPTNKTPGNQPIQTPSVSPTAKPSIQPTATPIVEPSKEITPNVPALATFLLLPPKRDGGQIKTVSLPAKTTDAAFGLRLESDDFESYKITLKDQSGKTLWQSGKLRSQKETLNVRIPARLLQNNIFTFSVSGIAASNEAESIGDYSFRCVVK